MRNRRPSGCEHSVVRGANTAFLGSAESKTITLGALRRTPLPLRGRWGCATLSTGGRVRARDHQWLQPGIPSGCEAGVLRDVKPASFGMRSRRPSGCETSVLRDAKPASFGMGTQRLFGRHITCDRSRKPSAAIDAEDFTGDVWGMECEPCDCAGGVLRGAGAGERNAFDVCGAECGGSL